MHMGRVYIDFRNTVSGLLFLYVQFQGEISISGVLVYKNALIRVCNTSGGCYVPKSWDLGIYDPKHICKESGHF